MRSKTSTQIAEQRHSHAVFCVILQVTSHECLFMHGYAFDSVCFVKAILVWLSAWYIFYFLVWSVRTDTCSLPSSESAKGNHYVDSHTEIKIPFLFPYTGGKCGYYSQRSQNVNSSHLPWSKVPLGLVYFCLFPFGCLMALAGGISL